ITNLTSGASSRFMIIRRNEEQSRLFSFLTGSAVAGAVAGMATKTISGQMTVEGLENDELVFTQNLPVNIETLAPEKMVKIGTQLGGMLSVILFLGIMIAIRELKNRRFFK
ncbi:MAG TPA: hypothetical protein VJG49_03665, partial [Candidatus Nanoarchaeia archaeon]|nr:hypothetical protein [Candidatus Nanoarchaeia archaeon]